MSKSNVPQGPAVHYEGDYLFFWGRELQLVESRFQNWYPSVFSAPSPTDPNESHRFPTAEHYIMYRKAKAMNDDETAERIINAATPKEANALGREVRNFDSSRWRSMVEQVAKDTAWFKFNQVVECREALLETGDMVLAEASPVDKNWGIGFAGDEAAGKEEQWGRNLAGTSLMEARERLRKEESSKASKV